MNILFAGTPEFACPALSWLIEHHRPVAILTQPDRPAGRGRKLTPSPVKQLALQADLPVLSPTTLKAETAHAELRELQPDLLITAAYGLLLPKAVLELPEFGCWNLHASLLPRWRGASPIQQAILAGDAETGVSLMQMDEGLDTGDVLMMRSIVIQPDETAGELQNRLSLLAAEILADGLNALLQKRMPTAQKQDDASATHAPRIRKSDALIDWNLSAETLARQVRGYNPWPVSHGIVDGETVRVFKAQALSQHSSQTISEPGQIISTDGSSRLQIACGRGVLQIDEIQSPGRRRLPASEWLRARVNRST